MRKNIFADMVRGVMTMDDYIKRKATIKAIVESRNRYYNSASNQYLVGRCEGLDIAEGLLRVAPAADVAPVVHGRWLKPHWTLCRQRVCSVCHNTVRMPSFFDLGQYTEYPGCPWCLAKMDGE